MKRFAIVCTLLSAFVISTANAISPTDFELLVAYCFGFQIPETDQAEEAMQELCAQVPAGATQEQTTLWRQSCEGQQQVIAIDRETEARFQKYLSIKLSPPVDAAAIVMAKERGIADSKRVLRFFKSLPAYACSGGTPADVRACIDKALLQADPAAWEAKQRGDRCYEASKAIPF